MRFFVLVISLILFSINSFALNLTSSVFENGGYIPDRYTCDGKNYSPPLTWNQVPKGTKSFVLIVDDPDAPVGTWVHWIVYSVPSDLKGLEENIDKEKLNSSGAKAGKNDFGRIGYGGPCPPSGQTHKYLFKLYALDQDITIEEGATKSEIINQIQGRIISETKLIGFYQRRQNEEGVENGKN